jgi:hypothetical protein
VHKYLTDLSEVILFDETRSLLSEAQVRKKTSINSARRNMADFRRWIYALALVALLAGFTVPVNASPPLQKANQLNATHESYLVPVVLASTTAHTANITQAVATPLMNTISTGQIASTSTLASSAQFQYCYAVDADTAGAQTQLTRQTPRFVFRS